VANIKSAQKQNRQRVKRTARNQARKSEMRTAVKKLRAAVAEKKADVARALLKDTVSLIDANGGKKVIKPNTRSRLVSRLTAAVNGL
jgi:small subunit ribosomal protein S20